MNFILSTILLTIACNPAVGLLSRAFSNEETPNSTQEEEVPAVHVSEPVKVVGDHHESRSMFAAAAGPVTRRSYLRRGLNNGSSHNSPGLGGSTGSFVPLTIGPSFQQAFSSSDLLRGFKLNIEKGENPFKPAVFAAPTNDIPFTTQLSESRVIQSAQSFEDMTEIKGSVSVSYGLLSGSGSGEFLRSVVGSTKSASIMHRTRHAAYATVVDTASGLTPTGEAQQLINQGRMEELTEKFGTKFVEQIVYGAQLDVLYTVTAREETDLTRIMAELKGKIGVGALAVKFRARFERQTGQTESELELKIFVKASGVLFTTPSNPTFDQTNDMIKDFNTRYSEMVGQIVEDIQNGRETAVLNQMSPVGFVLGSIADHVESLDQNEVAVLDSRMAQAASVLQRAMFVRAKLQKVIEQLRVLYTDPRKREEVFEPYEVQASKVLTTLDEKVNEVLAYRRLSVAKILGKGGIEPEPIPVYVDSGFQDLIDGYWGIGYLGSPLTILGNTFDDMHYIGYTIEDNDSGAVVPWMSGTVRLDKNDKVVANASSPEDLLDEVLSYLSGPPECASSGVIFPNPTSNRTATTGTTVEKQIWAYAQVSESSRFWDDHPDGIYYDARELNSKAFCGLNGYVGVKSYTTGCVGEDESGYHTWNCEDWDWTYRESGSSNSACFALFTEIECCSPL